MGYYADCIGGELEIKSDMFKKSIELLSEDKLFSEDMTAEIPDGIAEQGKMLCKLINEWDCNIESCLCSYEGLLLVRVWYEGGKWTEWAHDFFDLIAPAIADGCWIAFVGEDAVIWRYKYLNEQREVRYLDLGCDTGWEKRI